MCLTGHLRPLLHHRSSTMAVHRTVALEPHRHPTPAGSARCGPIRRSLWPGPTWRDLPAVPAASMSLDFPEPPLFVCSCQAGRDFRWGQAEDRPASRPAGWDRYTGRTSERVVEVVRVGQMLDEDGSHCSGGERSSQSTTRRRHVGRASKVSKARISARSCLDMAASISPRE